MYTYEINVSFLGSHFFATHGRSLTDQQLADKCYWVFKNKFPTEEGYEVSMTRYTGSGESYTPV
jgi:hypothetical protein